MPSPRKGVQSIWLVRDCAVNAAKQGSADLRECSATFVIPSLLYPLRGTFRLLAGAWMQKAKAWDTRPKQLREASMSKPEDDVRKDTDRLVSTPMRRRTARLKVSRVPTWLGPSFELCPQRGLRFHEALTPRAPGLWTSGCCSALRSARSPLQSSQRKSRSCGPCHAVLFGI